MIEQTSFFGMPLRTQHQRRLLVVLYYTVLFVLSVIALCAVKESLEYLAPQAVIVGGLLGGIKIGGPVKAYAYPQFPLGMEGPIQALNLAGRKLNRSWAPLDERERTQRDHAHYAAYRILIPTLIIAVSLYCLGMGASLTRAWMSNKGPLLAWVLMIYVLSLPQSVLLWTEPSEPAGELVRMRG